MNHHPLSYWIARNEGKICKGCGTRNRSRVSGYCTRCSHIANYWGHPQAKRMHRKDYTVEREEVKELLALNSDHVGIIKAIEFCSGMLEKAQDGIPQIRGSDDLLAILADRGATGEEVFIEVAALHVLYYRNDRRIKSKNHLRNLVGVRVLRLKRTTGTLTGRTNRIVGQHLIDGIGPVLLLNVARACDRRIELHQEHLKAQNQQLKIN